MINKIKLVNFKCYEDSDSIPFSQVNLLTGLNGRGKSTIFQAILALSQSTQLSGIHHLDLDGRFVQLGTFKDVLNRSADSVSFSIDIVTDDPIDNHLQFTFSPDQADERIAGIDYFKVDGRELVGYDQLITSDGLAFVDKEGKKFMVRHLESTSDVVGLKTIRNIQYISADRFGPVNDVDYSKQLTHMDTVGVRGEYVLNLLESRDEAFREQVREALSEVLSGASLEVRVTGNRISLLLNSSDAGAFFKPTNVGYGYGYLLTIITAVLSAKDGSIMIIENPEAHIHPGAQSKLMSLLFHFVTEKNLQLFIETHSDHVLNASLLSVKDPSRHISKDDLTILFFSHDKETDHTAVKRLEVLEQGVVSNAPREFFDQYAHDLRKIYGFE